MFRGHDDLAGTGNLHRTGGGGQSRNQGVFVDRGSLTTDSGVLSITGTAQAGTSKTSNIGVYGRNTVFDSADHLTIVGTGGGGSNTNDGVQLSKVDSFSGGKIEITGNGNSATSGKSNRGIYLYKNNIATDHELIIRGTSGSGTRDNQGVRLVGGSLSTTTYGLIIEGEALAATSQKFNIGAYIYNGAILAGSPITVTGIGGGGIDGLNHGIYMHKNITAPGAITTGTAGAGPDSETEAGDFFLP